MEDLQTWWEIPSIAHFCSLFRAAFNLLDFDIEDLELALLEGRGSVLIGQLLVRLLQGCLPEYDIGEDNHLFYLARLLRFKCLEDASISNPLRTNRDFYQLSLRKRVVVLQLLCDLRLESEDVVDLLKNLEADSLRVEPLGHDDSGATYWYFYGTRLYKESVEEGSRGGSRCRWQCVCHTADDWQRLAQLYESARSPIEHELYRTLKDDFLPEIPRLFSQKQKLQKKRQLEMGLKPVVNARAKSSPDSARTSTPASAPTVGGAGSADSPRDRRRSERRHSRSKKRRRSSRRSPSSVSSASSPHSACSRPVAAPSTPPRSATDDTSSGRHQKVPPPTAPSSSSSSDSEWSAASDALDTTAPAAQQKRSVGRPPGRRGGKRPRAIDHSAPASRSHADSKRSRVDPLPKPKKRPKEEMVEVDSEEERQADLARRAREKEERERMEREKEEAFIQRAIAMIEARESSALSDNRRGRSRTGALSPLHSVSGDVPRRRAPGRPPGSSRRPSKPTPDQSVATLPTKASRKFVASVSSDDVKVHQEQQQQRLGEDSDGEKIARRKKTSTRGRRPRNGSDRRVDSDDCDSDSEQRQFVGRRTNNSLGSSNDPLSALEEGVRRGGGGQAADTSTRATVNGDANKIRSSALVLQTDEELRVGMYKVLEAVKGHDDAWPFLDPVDEQYAPNYYSVIRRPMDLHKMESRLDVGHYVSRQQFELDFKLIVDNCKLYNGLENEYTEMVNTIDRHFHKSVSKYLGADEDDDESDIYVHVSHVQHKQQRRHSDEAAQRGGAPRKRGRKPKWMSGSEGRRGRRRSGPQTTGFIDYSDDELLSSPAPKPPTREDTERLFDNLLRSGSGAQAQPPPPEPVKPRGGGRRGRPPGRRGVGRSAGVMGVRAERGLDSDVSDMDEEDFNSGLAEMRRSSSRGQQQQQQQEHPSRDNHQQQVQQEEDDEDEDSEDGSPKKAIAQGRIFAAKVRKTKRIEQQKRRAHGLVDKQASLPSPRVISSDNRNAADSVASGGEARVGPVSDAPVSDLRRTSESDVELRQRSKSKKSSRRHRHKERHARRHQDECKSSKKEEHRIRLEESNTVRLTSSASSPARGERVEEVSRPLSPGSHAVVAADLFTEDGDEYATLPDPLPQSSPSSPHCSPSSRHRDGRHRSKHRHRRGSSTAKTPTVTTSTTAPTTGTATAELKTATSLAASKNRSTASSAAFSNRSILKEESAKLGELISRVREQRGSGSTLLCSRPGLTMGKVLDGEKSGAEVWDEVVGRRLKEQPVSVSSTTTQRRSSAEPSDEALRLIDEPHEGRELPTLTRSATPNLSAWFKAFRTEQQQQQSTKSLPPPKLVPKRPAPTQSGGPARAPPAPQSGSEPANEPVPPTPAAEVPQTENPAEAGDASSCSPGPRAPSPGPTSGAPADPFRYDDDELEKARLQVKARQAQRLESERRRAESSPFGHTSSESERSPMTPGYGNTVSPAAEPAPGQRSPAFSPKHPPAAPTLYNGSVKPGFYQDITQKSSPDKSPYMRPGSGASTHSPASAAQSPAHQPNSPQVAPPYAAVYYGTKEPVPKAPAQLMSPPSRAGVRAAGPSPVTATVPPVVAPAPTQVIDEKSSGQYPFKKRMQSSIPESSAAAPYLQQQQGPAGPLPATLASLGQLVTRLPSHHHPPHHPQQQPQQQQQQQPSQSELGSSSARQLLQHHKAQQLEQQVRLIQEQKMRQRLTASEEQSAAEATTAPQSWNANSVSYFKQMASPHMQLYHHQQQTMKAFQQQQQRHHQHQQQQQQSQQQQQQQQQQQRLMSRAASTAAASSSSASPASSSSALAGLTGPLSGLVGSAAGYNPLALGSGFPGPGAYPYLLGAAAAAGSAAPGSATGGGASGGSGSGVSAPAGSGGCSGAGPGSPQPAHQNLLSAAAGYQQYYRQHEELLLHQQAGAAMMGLMGAAGYPHLSSLRQQFQPPGNGSRSPFF